MNFIKEHKTTIICGALCLIVGWGVGYWQANRSFSRQMAHNIFKQMKGQTQANRASNERFRRNFNKDWNDFNRRFKSTRRAFKQQSSAFDQRFKRGLGNRS